MLERFINILPLQPVPFSCKDIGLRCSSINSLDHIFLYCSKFTSSKCYFILLSQSVFYHASSDLHGWTLLASKATHVSCFMQMISFLSTSFYILSWSLAFSRTWPHLSRSMRLGNQISSFPVIWSYFMSSAK